MRAWKPFAGIGPLTPADWFIERVTNPAEFGAALDRWKALRREGWDVTSLTEEYGGRVTAVIGFGCLYWGQMGLNFGPGTAPISFLTPWEHQTNAGGQGAA